MSAVKPLITLDRFLSLSLVNESVKVILYFVSKHNSNLSGRMPYGCVCQSFCSFHDLWHRHYWGQPGTMWIKGGIHLYWEEWCMSRWSQCGSQYSVQLYSVYLRNTKSQKSSQEFYKVRLGPYRSIYVKPNKFPLSKK